MRVLLLLVAICLSACHNSSANEFFFIRAQDGDSLLIQDQSGNKTQLRLLGIDTPEYSQEPWGKRAQNFVYSQIQAGEQIWIEYGREKTDKYSRTLAYVFYEGNGQKKFLNEEILRNGWAEIFIFDKNDPHNQKLKDALAFAKSNQLNIWQSNGLSLSPYKYRKLHKKH